MDLLEVTNKRSVPGFLILDHRQKPTFVNPVALRILHNSNGAKPPASERADDITIPVEISKLYENLKKSYHSTFNEPVNQVPSQNILFSTQNETLCCRGFLIIDQTVSSKSKKTSKKPFSIMILIEKISQHHKIDLDNLQERFDLTKRQIEILNHLVRGATNKKIADNLCVSEDTIKGHLKNIMKHLKVTSRTEILSMIFQY